MLSHYNVHAKHQRVLILLLSILFFRTSHTEILCDSHLPRTPSRSQKPKLADYAYNIYSQFGEDGILEKIFEIIGCTSKVCVEFGASDAFSCSNTARLWQRNDWKAVLIETDKELFKQCLSNTKGFNCIAIRAHIGYEEHDSLEYILQKHQVNEAIDLLSIDIDGNDCYILASLKHIKPRVIICEYNPTMPTIEDVRGEPNSRLGCSPGALINIGKTLGYQLVSITHTNCIFVRSDLFDLFNNFETAPEKLRDDVHMKYLVCDYVGNSCIIGKTELFPFFNRERFLHFHKNLGGECKVVSNTLRCNF